MLNGNQAVKKPGRFADEFGTMGIAECQQLIEQLQGGAELTVADAAIAQGQNRKLGIPRVGGNAHGLLEALRGPGHIP